MITNKILPRKNSGSGGSSSSEGEPGRERERSRSNSRAPRGDTLDFPDVPLSQLSKKQRKRELKARRERAKLAEAASSGGDVSVSVKETAGVSVKSVEKVNINVEKLGVDARVNVLKKSMGVDRVGTKVQKDLYVVCEDIRNPPKKVKVERDECEGIREGISRETGMDVDECLMSVNVDNGGVGEDPIKQMQAITGDLQRFLLSDANKVVKWVTDRVLSQAQKYEEILHRVLLENARLKGQLEATRNQEIGGLVTSVERMVDRIDEGVKCMNEVREGINKGVNGNASEKGNRTNGKSYAVIVKGAHEDLPTAEVRRRVAEGVSGEVNVRVRNVRPVRNGGVLVETVSEREREELARSSALRDAGLRAEEPRKLDPRVLIYDVPARMTNEQLLEGVFEKSMNGVIDKGEFDKRVRVVKRIERGGRDVGNVILELPMRCRERLLRDGRVFVGWGSFKVVVWESVGRCFKCLGYGHKMNECRSERMCWRCSRPGHAAATCRAAEECGNCRARKRPCQHSAVSPACPEYEWRVQMLRARLNDG